MLSVGVLFWEVDPSHEAVVSLLHEAYHLADLAYNAQTAAAWGEKELPGGIPRSTILEHERLLAHHGGNFHAMATERLQDMTAERMSHDRVDRLSPTNPELELLHGLVEGMPVDLPEGFYPNSSPGASRSPLRQLYRTAHKAVDALLYKLAALGWAFVLTMDSALTIPGIHFSPAHWAVKPAKQSGRAIVDSTDCTSLYPVLNSPTVAAAAEARFGRIIHPTIEDMVRTIWEFKSQHPQEPWARIALWKMDLRNAYHLLSFESKSCQLFAVELLGGICLIFLCGMFGWSATPACFQVVTRAIVYELGQRLLGRVHMYVDDVIGICLECDRPSEIATTTAVCTSLLGPDAVADDKTEFTTAGSRSIDFIGYTIDLQLLVVTLTRRNFLRTLYAFFSIDIERPLPVATIERLASLASRYSSICRELRPFTRALYRCTCGVRNRRASLILTPAARLAVHLWRAMLCLTALDPTRFARPFVSFVPSSARFVVEFDASLRGVGFVLRDYHRQAAGADAIMGAGALSLESLQFEDNSSYQNTAEFIAVVVALAVLIRHVRLTGQEVVTVELRGDSVTALQWAQRSSFRSSLVGNSAVLYALLLVRCNVQITGTVHVPGEENGVCDTLSRPGPDGLTRTVGEVLPGCPDLMDEHRSVGEEVVRLCDPRVDNHTIETLPAFWTAVGSLVRSL